MEYSDFEILGITTVFGNAGLEQATENALKIVELSGKKIPVLKGAGRPLVVPRENPPDFVHGVDGLGNTNWAASTLQVEPVLAADFIVETINTYPGEITILAVGRLTILANALALDPEIAAKTKNIVLMGGTLHIPGNVSPVGEANISGDPHAADLVFRGSWPVTMIGLDVTTGIGIGQTIIATYPHHLKMKVWKDQTFTFVAIEVDEAVFLKLISGS